jgi:hypothetical protein
VRHEQNANIPSPIRGFTSARGPAPAAGDAPGPATAGRAAPARAAVSPPRDRAPPTRPQDRRAGHVGEGGHYEHRARGCPGLSCVTALRLVDNRLSTHRLPLLGRFALTQLMPIEPTQHHDLKAARLAIAEFPPTVENTVRMGQTLFDLLRSRGWCFIPRRHCASRR